MFIKRGKPITLKLSEESQKKFDELYVNRIQNNGNKNKCDIMSQAIALLYEKEIGKYKEKGT